MRLLLRGVVLPGHKLFCVHLEAGAFFTSKGLQAQRIKSGDAEVLSFAHRLLKWQSGFKRALNIRPVPFPFLQSQPWEAVSEFPVSAAAWGHWERCSGPVMTCKMTGSSGFVWYVLAAALRYKSSKGKSKSWLATYLRSPVHSLQSHNAALREAELRVAELRSCRQP